MALPLGDSPFEYKWPVSGKTIDILSLGEKSNVCELATALIMADAVEVFAIVNGEPIVWIRISEQRSAA